MADISVAIAWNCSSCAGKGNFTKAGWIHIEPGQCRLVLNGNLGAKSKYLAYVAMASDGIKKWDGTTTSFHGITGVNVPNKFGPECWNTPEKFQVSFRFINIDSNNDFTLVLTASS